MKEYLADLSADAVPVSLRHRLATQHDVAVSQLVSAELCVLLAALDIAEALKFMHKSKVLHGDLKPQNILLVSVPKVRAPRWHCA
jgi:serine/threonine protein kinase